MTSIDIPPGAIRMITSRSGGPGGQNVNKVETRVTLEVDLDALPLTAQQQELVRSRLAGRISRAGVLRVTSQAERTQAANRDRALARLEELLREALHQDEPRRPTRVPRHQKRKRLEQKKRRSEIKRSRGRIDT